MMEALGIIVALIALGAIVRLFANNDEDPGFCPCENCLEG